PRPVTKEGAWGHRGVPGGRSPGLTRPRPVTKEGALGHRGVPGGRSPGLTRPRPGTKEGPWGIGGFRGSLPRADSVLPRRGAPRGSLLLANDHLGFDLLNPDEDLLAQRVRHQVVAAVLVDKLPDQLIEAILGQAGPAFVEVLANLRD